MTTLSTAVPTSMPSAAETYHTYHTHHGFLEFLPAVRRHANISFRQLPHADREEAVAEAVAAAFINYASAQRRGKSHSINRSMLATFAVRHVRDGRHVGGSQDSRKDVMSRKAQRARGFSVLRLPSMDGHVFDCLSAPDQPVWKDHLLHDRRTPPPDQVAFRIDWSRFLAQQNDRTRRAIGLLAAGYRRSEVADTLGVTRPAITQRMDRVRRDWEKFREKPCVADGAASGTTR
jgi:DNA-directed RNA polymerase specialized sigma24 family protein